MAIRPKTYHQANSFLQAIEIGEKVIAHSKTMDNQSKIAFQALYNYAKNYIESGLKADQLTAYSVKSLENEFFIYWNESVNEDIEIFWEGIVKHKLPYQRKSPIRDLLIKGRLRKVEQWIGLINHFNELQQSGFLNKQFSKKEIDQITKLIEAEKKKRFEFVNKCFQKKKIPFSQNLKFGASMAFLERCHLTLQYFSEKERAEIYKIWK